MSKDKLNPCPFCGKKLQSVVVDKCRNGYKSSVQCCCGARVEIISLSPQKEFAISKWNNRSGKNET